MAVMKAAHQEMLRSHFACAALQILLQHTLPRAGVTSGVTSLMQKCFSL